MTAEVVNDIDIETPLDEEKAVLGSMMAGGDKACDKALEILSAEDFERAPHPILFEKMAALRNAGQPVDPILLISELNGQLATFGGSAYVFDLVNKVPSALHVGFYAAKVKEASRRRTIKILSKRLAANPDDRDTRQAIQEILSSTLQNNPLGFEVPPTPVEFLRSEPRDIIRLKTGIESLDNATRGGIPTGIVSSIVGPPHIGKTALGSLIAVEAARAGFLTIILFKDEGRFAGTIRLAQQLGLHRAKMEERDEEELKRFDAILADMNIRLPDPDDKNCTLQNVITWGEREANGKPWLLLIDSIQSVYSSKEAENPKEDIRNKMEALEGAAKRGAWPFAISEMNRAGYQHKDAKQNINPLAAAAESRSIEYTSRLILSLSGDIDTVIQADVIKNSPGGQRLPIYLQFDPETAAFREQTEDSADLIVSEAKKERVEAKEAKTREKIRRALMKGQLNARHLRIAVGGDGQFCDDVRDAMIEEGEVIETPGRGQERIFSLANPGSVFDCV